MTAKILFEIVIVGNLSKSPLNKINFFKVFDGFP